MATRHRVARVLRRFFKALQRRPEPDNVLRLVTHNVWVGQKPGALLRNLWRLAIHTGFPHVIAVQEVKRLTRAPRGYQLVRVENPDFPDDRDMQLLVRNDVTVVRARPVYVDGPEWIGPKHGKVHPPKVFVGATLEHLGRRWDVLCVHRTWTGGKRNLESWAAEDDALADWIARRSQLNGGTRPVVLLGDWNGRLSDRGTLSVSGLAHRAEASLAFRGIDGAMAVNVTDLTARELDDLYGSDAHRPVAVEARV